MRAGEAPPIVDDELGKMEEPALLAGPIAVGWPFDGIAWSCWPYGLAVRLMA